MSNFSEGAFFSQGPKRQQCALLSGDWRGEKIHFALFYPYGELRQAAAKDLFVIINSFVGIAGA